METTKMRDKKRTYDIEVGQAEAPRVRPAKPASKNGDNVSAFGLAKSRYSASASEEQKQETQFSRELILRLIDWIKQI
jgi:hypothetical protein